MSAIAVGVESCTISGLLVHPALEMVSKAVSFLCLETIVKEIVGIWVMGYTSS